MTSETTPEGAVSYTYDAAARRATMTVAGQTAVSYSYDNADRLTGIAQGSTSVALGYDDANRRTSLTLPNLELEVANSLIVGLGILAFVTGWPMAAFWIFTPGPNALRRRGIMRAVTGILSGVALLCGAAGSSTWMWAALGGAILALFSSMVPLRTG